MGITERAELYGELEKRRGRPLIAYVTSPRHNAHGEMGADAIPELLDQIDATSEGLEAIDLLLVSNGGDPTVAWRIMSLLRERVKQVGVLVPQAAFSAATLLALGADEIVMHPNGNLGPVDPQITVQRRKPGSKEVDLLNFGSEDLVGFLDFARQQVGLTDQEHLRALFDRFCVEVGTVPVGVATRSARLSMSLGEKLLRMHMRQPEDATKVRAITEQLNKNFFHHGYPLSRSEATGIGLPVAPPNTDVESLMWRIWLDIEAELQAREPFELTVAIAKHPTAAGQLFGPVPQFNLPATDPAMTQLILQNLLQKHGTPVVVDPIPFAITLAVMESARLARRLSNEGVIVAARGLDLQLAAQTFRTFVGWKTSTSA